MGSVGIVAEYNPFHNGHEYQLMRAKAETGAQTAVVVMSGNFVERGDIAVADKLTRARWALQSGADLVLELPTLFALSSAQRFAEGAIFTLSATGVVDALCFGAETDSADELALASRYLRGEGAASVAARIKSGCSYPAAVAGALNDAGMDARILSANNILGMEYMAAIDKFNSAIRPTVVARLGASHDSAVAGGGFASASALREMLKRDDISAFSGFAPVCVYSDIAKLKCVGRLADINNISVEILYSVRRMTQDELRGLPDVTEGLENVIYRAARLATSYNELIHAVKCKRYTLARIRRIMLCAYLGISKDVFLKHSLPRYIRVLGVRRESVSLLSDMAKSSSLPVIARASDCKALSPEARDMLRFDALASELFPMALGMPAPAVDDFSSPLIIV